MQIKLLNSDKSWKILAILIGSFVVLPIATVIWLSLTPNPSVWGHLLTTVLPRYLGNSILLGLSVGAGVAVLGTVLAYWVTHYRFPGRRFLQYLLFLPLAVPPFVAGFALADFLEAAGPLQTGLRNLFGWDTARDYYFPQIRSFGGAAIVLTLTLYPYVYLFARAGFAQQSQNSRNIARSSGVGGVAYFFQIALPLAWPGAIVGVALAMMETLNDFGTVQHFAVQTLTTGIFTQWLEARNIATAAQIGLFIIILMAFILWLDRWARGRRRFATTHRRFVALHPEPTTGFIGLLMTLTAGLVLLLGFILPVAILLSHSAASSLTTDLWRAALNTAALAGAAAILVPVFGYLLIYGTVVSALPILMRLKGFWGLGYAMPGAILALGLYIPIAAFDHRLADGIWAITGQDPGLLISGGMGLLLLAYCIRFLGIASGAAEAGFATLSPNLTAAGKTLGAGPLRMAWQVYRPLLSGGFITAMILVFIDASKELSVTLFLQPFNFETLASYAYAQASLEQLQLASPAALIITGLSFFGIIILAMSNREEP